MLRTLPSFRWLVAGALVATGVSVAFLPALTWAQEDASPHERRQDKINELEKQIQDLNSKLAALKTTSDGVKKTTSDGTIPQDWIKSLTWRSIGPAGMGGRITAISVFEADPSTYWVATASGGLVKTVNNGITFEHQFDGIKRTVQNGRTTETPTNDQGSVSIGDVCVAPSNRDIVWVGTGEGNPRNSVSYGDGVYKSTDGGKTWKHMGLDKTYQIGKILIHPKNPDIVYVGALGRLYGPNEDRGLYKTTDGGKSWNKILFVDDSTGVIDMRMHPHEPDTLLVAMWTRQRDGFDDFLGPPPPEGIDAYDPVIKFGKGGGIYKTTDGGQSFKKLSKGLPTCATGRIGLDIYQKNPNTVFAIVDSEKFGTGLPPIMVTLGVQASDKGDNKIAEVVEDSPADKAGLQEDDVILSVGGKPVKNFDALKDQLRGRKPGDKIKIAYQRGDQKKETVATLAPRTPAGGRGMGGGRGGRGGRGGMVSPGFFGEEAEDGGIIITQLTENGPAAKAGLKVDDWVTRIDGKPIENMFRSLRQFMSGHQAGDKIKVDVVRGAKKFQATITLEPLTFGGFRSARREIPGRIKRPYATEFGGNRENVQDEQGPGGDQSGGVYKSTDAGETWTRLNSVNHRPMYFSVIRVDPEDDKHIFLTGITMLSSKDGGKTFDEDRTLNRGLHSDQHAMWIDPHDGRHMLIGTDGGFYQTYDRAAHWDHLNQMAFGQFYHVAVDPRPLYKVYGGLQDNGSWGGPAITQRRTGPINQDWIMVGGGDGFVCRVDQSDPDIVYSESQGGAISRLNVRTGERMSVRPKRTPGKPAHRFNWNSPYILSSFNPSIFYCAGEYVWRSVKRGEHLKVISPEITRTNHGSATALAESPRNPDVLYVGTDDGALWVTRDGGSKWTNIADKVGLPGPRWVASIEPSRYVEGRVYVAFDAHRSDDDQPYVYVSEDYGQTWKSLRGNLPVGSSRVCREDIQNENLLYVGTEFAAWVSANRGATWTKLNNNLPVVAVHEFAQHPTSGEIVAATHGRSLWVLDVTPLRQITAETLKAKAHLYQPNTYVRWHEAPGEDAMFSGAERRFVGQNPPREAFVYYSLTRKADKVTLKIEDYTGKVLLEEAGQTDPGMHRVAWNLSREQRRGGRGGMGGGRGGASGAMASGRGGRGAASARGGAARQRGGAAAGQAQGSSGAATASSTENDEEAGAFMRMFLGAGDQVNPGMYRVVLNVDGQEFSQGLRVEADPTQPGPIITSDGDDDGDQDP